MKKILFTSILAILFLSPLIASAQVGQFIPFLRWTNATGTQATTTSLYVSNYAKFEGSTYVAGGVNVLNGGLTTFYGSGGITGPAGANFDNTSDGDLTFSANESSDIGGNIFFYPKGSGGIVNIALPWVTGSLAPAPYQTGYTDGSVPFGSSGLLATSSAIVFDNSLSKLTVTNLQATSATTTSATTTNFAISGIASGNCLQTSTGGVVLGTGSACGAGGSSFAWPFTKLGSGEQATSTTLSLLAGLTSASSTFTAEVTIVPMTSALLQTGAGGLVAEYAGTSCTNQFPRSLSALGIATCATVANTDLANSTISGVALGSNLANLSATNGTLTFSGTYNGSAARTIGLNLGNANDWTALQTFANASSTLFSSTIASTSQLILSGAADGCLQVGGGNVSSTGSACGSGGGGISWPFTKQAGGEQATSTIMEWIGGYLSNASSTHTGSTTLATTLMTNATSTNLHVSSLASTTNLRANTALVGNAGVATTSPVATLAVEQNGETASFQVSNNGSSTPSFVVRGVNGNGNVGIGSSSPTVKFTVEQTDGFASYVIGNLAGTRSAAYSKATMTADPGVPRLVGGNIGEVVFDLGSAPAAALEAGGFNGVCTVVAGDDVVYPGTSICKGGGVFASYAGTGSISRVNGLTSSTLRAGAGTVTNLGSMFSQVTNLTGSGTTVHAYHLYLDRPISTAGATWSTTTAIYIANQTPAAGTLTTGAFGIYQDGNSNRNYLGGTLGVNVISPGSRLHIIGGTNDVLLVQDDSGTCEAQPTTTGLTWSCSSDERLKSDITPSTFKSLDYLNSIPLFDYTVNKTGEREVGPVAQRLTSSHPELVTLSTTTEKSDQVFGEDNEQYQVSSPSTWQLVKAIQELWQMFTGHDSRIDQLERENAALKARLDALESKIIKPI